MIVPFHRRRLRVGWPPIIRDGLAPIAWRRRSLRALAGGLLLALLSLNSGVATAVSPPAPLGLVSVETIFAETHPDFARLDPARVHRLLVTGDVGLVRMVNLTTVTMDDFTWPFQAVRELLRDPDLTFINLEGPLLTGCPLRRTGLVFCGDPRNIAGLTFAGVDVASLANNHMLNHGRPGLDSTRGILDAAGIAHAGFGTAAIRQVDEVRFGFLAYNAAGERVNLTALRDEISALREEVDVLVVMFHWGAEYVRIPVPGPGVPGAPRDLARAAIDAGADLVVGNHPHWFQGVEVYRGSLIAYSHGNFIFDQPWSEATQQGMIGLYTFYDDRLIDAQFSPIRIEGWGRPRLAVGEERARLLDVMRRASEALRTY